MVPQSMVRVEDVMCIASSTRLTGRQQLQQQAGPDVTCHIQQLLQLSCIALAHI
jgi:hypothetical protein